MYGTIDQEPLAALEKDNSKTKDEDQTNQIVSLCEQLIQCIVKEEHYPQIEKTIKTELENKFNTDSFTVEIGNEVPKADVGQYYYVFRLTKDGLDTATMIIYQQSK